MTTPPDLTAAPSVDEATVELLAAVEGANHRARRARALYFSAPESFIGPPLPPDAIEAIRTDEHQAAIDRFFAENPATGRLPQMPAIDTITLDRMTADRIASALMSLLMACERIQAEQPERRFLSPRVRPKIEAHIRQLRPD